MTSESAAVPASARILPLTSNCADEDSVDPGRYGLAWAKTLRALGEHEAALEAAARARQAWIRALGPNAAPLVDVYVFEGDAARDRGDFESARNAYRRALAVWRPGFRDRSVRDAIEARIAQL